MKIGVVIHHPPTKADTTYVHAMVSSRVQRIWFSVWELRIAFSTWRSARKLYGADRVGIEIVGG